MSIRVLIVDDHAVVRKGLRMFLGLDEELQIIGEAEDGRGAVRLAAELEPDVVLMDLLMPGMDGIAATKAIREAQPNTQVVALTSALEDELVFQAIRAGAAGYLLKHTQGDELCKAIKAAAAGQVQLSPEAMQQLMGHVSVSENPDELTPREIDVIRLIAAGMTNRQIGVALGITEKTVKAHVSNILSKLDVGSRTEAALYAARVGLVSLEERA
ncbi:MAG: response regulator [Anaerolineae bacterium]